MVACLAQPGMSAAAVDPLSGQSIHPQPQTWSVSHRVGPGRSAEGCRRLRAEAVHRRRPDRVYAEEVTSYDWQASNAGLSVGDKRIDAFPVSHSFIPADGRAGVRSTGSDGRSAPVVDIGSGKVGDHDVRGKIVPVRPGLLSPDGWPAAAGRIHPRPRRHAFQPGRHAHRKPVPDVPGVDGARGHRPPGQSGSSACSATTSTRIAITTSTTENSP